MKIAKVEKIDYTKFDNLKPIGNTCMVQSDTDSMYMSADELFQLTPDMSDEKFMKSVDKIFNNFWQGWLTAKAKNENVEDLIYFARENMFAKFLSIQKKMYIGVIVDSDAKGWIGYEHPERKIQGVSLKKSAMPSFCKGVGIPLILDITDGMSFQDTNKRISAIYREYRKQKPNDICTNGSISDMKKTITKPISEYLNEPILAAFKAGWAGNIKPAFAYNYIIEKFDLPLTPIASGEKFNLICVKPTNQFGIDSIAFVDEWPEQFDKFFEIDYEKSFRKYFLPIFETVYEVLGWKASDKDVIQLNTSSLSFLIKK